MKHFRSKFGSCINDQGSRGSCPSNPPLDNRSNGILRGMTESRNRSMESGTLVYEMVEKELMAIFVGPVNFPSTPMTSPNSRSS